MTTNTGGPAFPLHNHGAQTLGLEITGMTLRDHFAGLAMQANVSAAPYDQPMDRTEVATWCYAMSDAMLKEREK
jgi:hypothetical protein